MDKAGDLSTEELAKLCGISPASAHERQNLAGLVVKEPKDTCCRMVDAPRIFLLKN